MARRLICVASRVGKQAGEYFETEQREIGLRQDNGTCVFLYKFSPNLMNGLICEARARAKQSLLRRS